MVHLQVCCQVRPPWPKAWTKTANSQGPKRPTATYIQISDLQESMTHNGRQTGRGRHCWEQRNFTAKVNATSGLPYRSTVSMTMHQRRPADRRRCVLYYCAAECSAAQRCSTTATTRLIHRPTSSTYCSVNAFNHSRNPRGNKLQASLFHASPPPAWPTWVESDSKLKCTKMNSPISLLYTSTNWHHSSHTQMCMKTQTWKTTKCFYYTYLLTCKYNTMKSYLRTKGQLPNNPGYLLACPVSTHKISWLEEPSETATVAVQAQISRVTLNTDLCHCSMSASNTTLTAAASVTW